MLGGLSCVCLFVSVCAVLFNVCDLFVNVVNGVVWFVCIYYYVCMCVMCLCPWL